MTQKFLALIIMGAILFFVLIVVLILYLRKDDFISKIEDLLSNGDYPKALHLLLKRIDLHPHDFALKYYLGQTYEGLREYNKAVLYYQKAAIGATEISQLPIKLKLFYKLAELYRKMGKLKEALGYYILVLDKNPSNIRALFHIGEIYFELHNYQKASEALQKLLKFNPAHIRAHSLLSEIFRKNKNYTSAALHMEYILDNDQSGDKVFLKRIRMELGLTYLEMKNYTKCENVLQPLLTDATYFSESLLTVLNALIESRQTEKALALIDIQQKDYPANRLYELLYAKGQALYADHLYYEAILSWKEAHSLNPDYQDLRNLYSKFNLITAHPKLDNVFSSDDEKREAFIHKLSHSQGVGRILKTKHYWIFRLGDFVYVLYLIPFPTPVKELIEMQDKIAGNFQATSAFTLLSLFGIDKVEKDTFDYKKLTVINEERFIEVIEKESLSN